MNFGLSRIVNNNCFNFIVVTNILYCCPYIYRSGTEEEYTELAQLLEDICTYMCDLVDIKNKEKEEKRKKELNERMQAEDMRKTAMEGLVRSSTLNYKRDREGSYNATALDISGESSVASSVEDFEDLAEDTHPLPKKCKKEKNGWAKMKTTEGRKLTKLSAIEMLEKKFQQKAKLKEKELELKRFELELKKNKLEIEEAKQKEAEEERKLRLKMELEERKVMMEFIKKHMDK